MAPNKYIEKQWHKINGKVHLTEETMYGWLLVIIKGNKKMPRYIAMQAAREGDISDRVSKLKAGDRVKCRYLSYSILHQGKWHTNLSLKDLQPWPVGEEKAKKKEAMDKAKDNQQYNKGSQNLFGWRGNEFMDSKK